MSESNEQELAAIRKELKQLFVEELSLEDMTPADIGDDETLFGEGLGFDSLDAVEIVVILQRKYGIEVPEEVRGREIFSTVRTLSNYIYKNRKPEELR